MKFDLTNAMRLVILVAALLCVPALLLRAQVERPGPVVLVMDGESLADDAREQGKTLLELMNEYRALGVGGIGLYEQTLRGWFDQGLVTYQSGVGLRLLYPNAQIKPGWYYVTGPESFLEPLRQTWTFPTERVLVGTQTWIGAPFDFGSVPAGFDLRLASELKAAGFYIVARPLNSRIRKLQTLQLPPETDAVLFSGAEVLGFPNDLQTTQTVLGGKPITLIEGAPQRGFSRLARDVPVLRLFAMRTEWLLQQTPAEATGRFLLAARERGHQILYLRPFPDPEDTTAYLTLLKTDLERSRIPVGTPAPREFEPSPFRWAAVAGILAGLVLLAVGLPQPIGVPLTVLLALFCLGAARGDAGPLLAAIAFPVLGFLEPHKGMRKWVAAVFYALLGVVFLAALGSRPETLLTLETFRGVSLTLILPPLLVALSFLPRDFKGVFNSLYTYPLRLGDVALGVLGLGILALVLLRRGNDASPAIVPDWEITLRQTLQDVMVRPRFKEIFGHALAPLALLLPWPKWIQIALLMLVAVGVGSIMNTFSHYHTPLSISFFRVLNGMVIGLILGFAGVWAYRRVRQWWLG